MEQYQQFEHTRIAFMAQLSNLTQQLRSATEAAEKYATVVAQMPYPAPGGMPFAPVAAAAHDAPAPRKRKNGAVGSDDGEGGGRRKKKERDPNQPKRPASAYLFYQNEVRQQLKAAHPFTPHHELLGMIAQQWNAMSPEEKKPYEDRQKTAKGKYDVDIAAYNLKTGKEPKGAKKAKTESPPVAPVIVPVVETPSLASESPSPSDEEEVEDEVAPSSDEEEEEEEEEEEIVEPVAKKPKSSAAPPPVAPTPAKGKKEKKVKA